MLFYVINELSKKGYVVSFSNTGNFFHVMLKYYDGHQQHFKVELIERRKLESAFAEPEKILTAMLEKFL